MASSKDIPQIQTARPLGQRSTPCSYNSIHGSSGLRMPHSRTNSNTLAACKPLLHEHRVRRKSIVNNNSNNANAVALAAAASKVDLDKVLPISIERHGPGLASLSNNLPLQAASVPVGDLGLRGSTDAPRDDDADDQDNMSSEAISAVQLARGRRASDSAKEGRRFNRPIIICPHPGCEKQYKHSSCLEKHKWEHTDAWAVTSRLLISKHQQVQILEAAKLLVGMTTHQPASDMEPTFEEPSSPSLSGGFSEQTDGQSSARTTPPPETYSDMHMDLDEMNFSMASDDEDDARGELSRQLRNDTACKLPGFGRYVEPSPTPGPVFGETDGEADLSRAVALLSCSYTSSGLPGQLHNDVPPVPQVPLRWLQGPESFPESFTRTPVLASGSVSHDLSAVGRAGSRHIDSRMDDDDDDDDDDSRPRARSDEEDDGFFGSMDE